MQRQAIHVPSLYPLIFRSFILIFWQRNKAREDKHSLCTLLPFHDFYPPPFCSILITANFATSVLCYVPDPPITRPPYGPSNSDWRSFMGLSRLPNVHGFTQPCIHFVELAKNKECSNGVHTHWQVWWDNDPRMVNEEPSAAPSGPSTPAERVWGKTTKCAKVYCVD